MVLHGIDGKMNPLRFRLRAFYWAAAVVGFFMMVQVRPVGGTGGRGQGRMNPFSAVPPPPNQPPPVFPSFGPKAGCSLTGSRVYKTGAYCYPFQRFTISAILQSPAFKGCCRPCPEQFGLELGFLEITEEHKTLAMDRFHRWAAERHGVPHLNKVQKNSALFQERESRGGGGGGQSTMRQRKGGGGGAAAAASAASAATSKGGSGAPKPAATAAAKGGAGASSSSSKSGSSASKSGAAAKSTSSSKSGAAAKSTSSSKSGAAAKSTSSSKSGSSASKSGASSKAAAEAPPPIPAAGGGKAADSPPPPVPPPPPHDYSDDASRLGGDTFGMGLLGQMPQGGGVTGMSLGGFVSGPQVERLLPCCKVCPEQFLMPTALSDVTTSFVEASEKAEQKEEEEQEQEQEEGAAQEEDEGLGRRRRRRRRTEKSRNGFPSFSSLSSSATSSSSSSSKGGAKGGGGGPTDMDTGYQRSACCNMCDKKTMAQKSPAAFIELMEQGMGRKRAAASSYEYGTRSSMFSGRRQDSARRRRGFVGSLAAAAGNAAMSAAGGSMHGNTGSCCPMCPSLQTILNSNVAPDEAFGGPFGKALESGTVGAPFTHLEKDMLKQLAEEANMDETAAGRDPGIAAAARARAAASLAGNPVVSTPGLGAMSSLVRL